MYGAVVRIDWRTVDLLFAAPCPFHTPALASTSHEPVMWRIAGRRKGGKTLVVLIVVILYVAWKCLTEFMQLDRVAPLIFTTIMQWYFDVVVVSAFTSQLSSSPPRPCSHVCRACLLPCPTRLEKAEDSRTRKEAAFRRLLRDNSLACNNTRVFLLLWPFQIVQRLDYHDLCNSLNQAILICTPWFPGCKVQRSRATYATSSPICSKLTYDHGKNHPSNQALFWIHQQWIKIEYVLCGITRIPSMEMFGLVSSIVEWLCGSCFCPSKLRDECFISIHM